MKRLDPSDSHGVRNNRGAVNDQQISGNRLLMQLLEMELAPRQRYSKTLCPNTASQRWPSYCDFETNGLAVIPVRCLRGVEAAVAAAGRRCAACFLDMQYYQHCCWVRVACWSL